MLAALLTAGLAGGALSLPDGRIEGLKRLVRQDCGSCHGLTLKGGLGKALLPADLAPRSATEIADIIMDGLPGTPMPPWKGLLTREEAEWIAVRLKEGFPP
jgi:cytochrome c55X